MSEDLCRIIATVERNLPRWKVWFPNENSEVEIARKDLLSLVSMAKSYLAEHQADDGNAITAAWLRSIGFTEGGMFGGLILVTDHDDRTRTEVGFHKRHGWTVGAGNIVHLSSIRLSVPPKIRGDLRRLCRALGVELKESV